MSVNKEREEVKKRIQKWLLDEGFKVQSVSNEHASFNFVAEDAEGRKVNIIQPIKKIDQIIIATRAVLTQEQIDKLSRISEDERNRILWTLRFGLLDRGVGFSPISMPLESIQVSTVVYYDGLNKDNFMHRLFEVRKALLFIFWTIDRELGEPKPTLKLSYIG